MIAFRGTPAFRQYMPAKPTNYGIRVWMRADSQNGYANEFEVYVGRPAGQKHEVGLGKKVILKLTEKLVGKNNIYFDRFFNSVDLHQELLRRKLFGCGTVKRNVKNLPVQIANKKPKRGEPVVPKLKLNPGEFNPWRSFGDSSRPRKTHLGGPMSTVVANGSQAIATHLRHTFFGLAQASRTSQALFWCQRTRNEQGYHLGKWRGHTF